MLCGNWFYFFKSSSDKYRETISMQSLEGFSTLYVFFLIFSKMPWDIWRRHFHTAKWGLSRHITGLSYVCVQGRIKSCRGQMDRFVLGRQIFLTFSKKKIRLMTPFGYLPWILCLKWFNVASSMCLLLFTSVSKELLQFSREIHVFRWMVDFICVSSKVFYQEFLVNDIPLIPFASTKKKTLINLVAYSSCLR